MDNGLPAIGRLSAAWLDFFVLIGAIGLVLVAALLWALFFRKSVKRRIRRRKHRRSLNPTLAETGGLPPVRTEEKSPESPPQTPTP